MRRDYVAGYVYFSAAAYHYQAAAWRPHLTFLPEEAAFGRWFWQAKSKFYGLRDRLALDVLQPTARYLAESGDALCQAATEYAETDAELAAQFDGILEDGTQNDDGETVLASVDDLQELTPSLNDEDTRTPGNFPGAGERHGPRDGSVFAPEKVGF